MKSLAMYSSIEVKRNMQFIMKHDEASKCDTDSPLQLRCICAAYILKFVKKKKKKKNTT